MGFLTGNPGSEAFPRRGPTLPRRTMLLLPFLLGSSGCGLGLNPSCKSDPAPVFATAFTDFSGVSGLVPPGQAVAGLTTSTMVISPTSTAAESAVFAPTELELVRGSYYAPASAGGRSFYLLEFRVSCEVSLWLDLITEPISEIRALFSETASATAEAGESQVAPLVFKAGTRLGKTTGESGTARFRLGVMSTAGSTDGGTAVNPLRLLDTEAGRRKRFSVCPLAFLSPELRSTAESKLTEEEGSSAAGGSCPGGLRDRDGTLSGDWRKVSAPSGLEASYASLLSVATTAGGRVRISGLGGIDLEISQNLPTHKDPAAVSSTHCYVKGFRVAWFRIEDSQKLSAYTDESGSCPTSAPTASQVATYER